MRRKLLTIIVALVFALQLLPLDFVLAAGGEDLAEKGWLTVYDTTGDDTHDPPLASYIRITEPDGGTPIDPDENGNYFDVPAGATLELLYAFSLSDGQEPDINVYAEGDYFIITLPGGLEFSPVSGSIPAVDASGEAYTLADWEIMGNELRVVLTAEGAEERSARWGKLRLDGTFQPLESGDEDVTTVHFGSQTIIIYRQPLPLESTLAKSGSYNAETNEITWTVVITPPTGNKDISYRGFTVEDSFSDNQVYVPGSFTVKNGTEQTALVPDEILVIGEGTIDYTFPNDTSGVQVITYKTKPTSFAGADGVSIFDNTVDLHRNGETAAEPETGWVTLDWIDKTGGVSSNASDEPGVVLWTVTVKVPGKTGASITGAKIIDQLHADLELLKDDEHPVQIKFGSGTAQAVSEGTGAGQYSYSPEEDTLTYFFPEDNQPQAGNTVQLTFYTRVKESRRDDFLDDNDAIDFTNSATLCWDDSFDLTKSPSTSYTTSSDQGNGVGSGGLLAKSATDNNESYLYLDKDIIQWTITVNRNRINLTNAMIEDEIPAGQELLLNETYPLTVKDDGQAYETFEEKTSTGTFIYTAPGEGSVEKLGYYFPSPLNSTFTIIYFTRIVDWASLYYNGTVGFANTVKLYRDGDEVEISGTKDFASQMLNKTIVKAYDYTTHLTQWQVVVNRNKLPLNNGIVTDSLPEGMVLFIDDDHLFEVEALGGGAAGSHDAQTDGIAFTVTLPTPTTDQYTIRFWTKLTNEALGTKWDNQKNFTNEAFVDSDEIDTPIRHTATARIRNPVITKSGLQGDDSSGQYSDTIYWSVLLNLAQVPLTNAVVSDTLHPAIQLEQDSIKLYSISVNPENGQGILSSKVPITSGYTVTYPTADNNNTLSIALPQANNSAYLLEFSTVILDNKIGTLYNNVELTGESTSPVGTGQSGSISVDDYCSLGGSGINSLTVKKTDSDENPLPGAMFRLVNAGREPIHRGGNEIIETTDSNGEAVFTGLPAWVFFVEEIEPALGYLIPEDSFFYGERLSGAGEVTVRNNLGLTEVSFAKIGAGGVALSGGLFTLTGKDYEDVEVYKEAIAVNGTVTFSGVSLNKVGQPYVVREIEAPTGHAVSDAELLVTVEYNEQKTGLVVTINPHEEFANIPLETSVSFTKTGEGGILLSGGSFRLVGKDYLNRDVDIQVAADAGLVTFPGIQIGSYSIFEIDSPNGYLMPADQEILQVEVLYNSDNTGLVAVIRGTLSGMPIVTSYKNKKALGDISFQKMAEDGALISGGEFLLSGLDCVGNPVLLSATSVNGTVTFTGVPVDDGNGYSIQEIIPPEGYRLSSTLLVATVRYNEDKTAVVTWISEETLSNEKVIYAEILVIKTDEDGNRLAGAEFTLYNNLGEAIATAVSNEEGIASFGNIAEGFNYTIRETKAPAGYIASEESIQFSIENSSLLTFTAVNKKQREELPRTGASGPGGYVALGGISLLLVGVILKRRRESLHHQI